MNLGGAEILVIIVIGIMVLGPDKLPSALRMFGKTMGEIKKYQDLAKGEISKAMDSTQSDSDVQDQEDSKKIDENENAVEHELEIKETKKSKKPDKEQTGSFDTVAPILDDD